MDGLIPVDLLTNVDIFSPNETELERLTGMPTESFEQISQSVAKIHEMKSNYDPFLSSISLVRNMKRKLRLGSLYWSASGRVNVQASCTHSVKRFSLISVTSWNLSNILEFMENWTLQPVLLMRDGVGAITEEEQRSPSLLLCGVRSSCSEGRPSLRLHQASVHQLEERFYFGDHVLPCFETGIPLLKRRLHQLPNAENIVCNKVRDGDKRIVRLKEGNPAAHHVLIVDNRLTKKTEQAEKLELREGEGKHEKGDLGNALAEAEEVVNIATGLGENTLSLIFKLENRDGTPKDQLSSIKQTLKELQCKREERMKEFCDIQSQIIQVHEALHGSVVDEHIVDDKNLTTKRLRELKLVLQGLQSEKKRNPRFAHVYLNVYDLHPINGSIHWLGLGLGLYHSGIQVHGVDMNLKRCLHQLPDAENKRNPRFAPVYLNVYDLHPINGSIHWLGLSLYHSGIQVHGVEYEFGGRESPSTGIFRGKPRECPRLTLRKSILIGRMDLGPHEVHKFMEELSKSYTGTSYNLITKNCSHFCNDVSLRLTGKRIPRWINRLAKSTSNCCCKQAARSAGVPVILDAGGMDGLIPVDLLTNVDIFSPNETELECLTRMPTESFEQISQSVAKIHEMKRNPRFVPVNLNVYDLHPINGSIYWLGLGLYHFGIQVHGVEYEFGGHDFPSTSIFRGKPRECPGLTFRKSILIRRTDLGPHEVHKFMEDLSKSYTGTSYNLITKNCNHFCNDVSLRLIGKRIPHWINRLAKIGEQLLL
ncbi:hypothetical protein Sjap_004942 [Stephania japonica]|uniref:PPPDE domain-containing protein n=1 Tax=Stephania japonica TaxID=461633 RepID=A0AAP0K4F6_9MAGN